MEPAADKHSQDVLELDQDHLMWREVEDEIVVLDKRSWTYVGINGSGAVLWKEIANGRTTPARLIEHLCSTYEIDEQRASLDVEAFLSMLYEHGLLGDREP